MSPTAFICYADILLAILKRRRHDPLITSKTMLMSLIAEKKFISQEEDVKISEVERVPGNLADTVEVNWLNDWFSSWPSGETLGNFRIKRALTC